MMGKCILFLTVFCAFTLVTIEGKRVLLRPISAAEVHRILKNAGREDAIPQGRVISHGIAAYKGFTLGFKKGVLGVAIIDGLAALHPSNSTTTTTTTTPAPSTNINTSISSILGINKPSISYNSTTNELCFTSRSATSDLGESGAARDLRPVSATSEIIGTGTTPTVTTSGTTSPTTTDNVTREFTGTGTGTKTATNSETTTQTGTGGTVNCIVISKT